jgi:hypothetical protein
MLGLVGEGCARMGRGGWEVEVEGQAAGMTGTAATN